MSKADILLVEDDANIAAVITEALGDEGFEVTICSAVESRDRLLSDRTFDVMLTDVILEDGDGLATIGAVHALAPEMPIIVLSAQNTLDTAVRASDSRAFEYFPKPFDIDELVDAVKAAVNRTNKVGQDTEAATEGGLPLIGRSAPMQNVYRLITRVMRHDLTVLVTGESGTGKELVAEAIHQLGARRTGPFVAVNAAAIPRDLIESELFGHERGAFTGAVTQQIGKFEQANGGTLFLDEIGDMPADAQTRLLRTLQSGRIRRVGGRHEINVDVRIIAATNRDLEPAIRQGAFRDDLFYRLNVVPIHLPPLRERKSDIGALARHFLAQASQDGLPYRNICDAAVTALENHRWPGNVRELRNVVFRLALLCRDDTIDRHSVTDLLRTAKTQDCDQSQPELIRALEAWLDDQTLADGTVYHAALTAFERPLFERALRETDGNQVRAAQRLGINRNTLRKKMIDLGIVAHDFVGRR